MSEMTSNRPYLVRAMYEWILDNDCTPYLLVDAESRGTVVPREFVRDGQIVLNLSPSAVINLVMDNQAIQCNARFGGTPMAIHVPTGAVLGIYARENGQGMLFDEIGRASCREREWIWGGAAAGKRKRRVQEAKRQRNAAYREPTMCQRTRS